MHHTVLAENDGNRVFALILEAGDEAFSCITRFVNVHRLTGASLTAIGAFELATIGFFDFTAKSYLEIPVNVQSEVLSLIGDVAEGDDGRAQLHLGEVVTCTTCLASAISAGGPRSPSHRLLSSERPRP